MRIDETNPLQPGLGLSPQSAPLQGHVLVLLLFSQQPRRSFPISNAAKRWTLPSCAQP